MPMNKRKTVTLISKHVYKEVQSSSFSFFNYFNRVMKCINLDVRCV